MNDYNERSIWLRLRGILSMNDPKRPPSGKDGEGPPDLDEMWRDFNRKLSGVFGRKGSGGGLGRPDNGRGARIGVGIVIGVLIAIYLGSGVFVVQDGQAGVVTQFGKYRYTAAQGVHWRLPYPFEAQELVNIGDVRSVEIGRNNIVRLANVKDASMLTHDGDIVDVRFAVQYQVRNPNDYLFRSADPDQSVVQAGQAAVRSIVGARSTDDILYQDRETIRQQLTDAIQHSLDESRTGLVVTGVTIQSVQAPEQVQAAFDDAAKAHQDRERAKVDAQAYANDLLPHAQADAARLVDEAKTYSDQVVAQAQGDAERFKQVYEQYAKAPAVIRERMYLDTMQHIYANSTKVFVDSKASNNVMYLPLDKLIEATRQHATEAAAASGASGASGAAAASQANSAAASSTAANLGGVATAPNVPSAASAADAASAASAASDSDAASDPLRSRDAFRSRGREDDIQ